MNAPVSTSVAWLGVLSMHGLAPGSKRASDNELRVVTEPADPFD